MAFAMLSDCGAETAFTSVYHLWGEDGTLEQAMICVYQLHIHTVFAI